MLPWSTPSSALGRDGDRRRASRADAQGQDRREAINVIAFCGDGGGMDMGMATHLRAELVLIIMYDNESYARHPHSGASPWGVNTTFTPPGIPDSAVRRTSGVPPWHPTADTIEGRAGASASRGTSTPSTLPQGVGLRPLLLPRAGRAGLRAGRQPVHGAKSPTRSPPGDLINVQAPWGPGTTSPTRTTTTSRRRSTSGIRWTVPGAIPILKD